MAAEGIRDGLIILVGFFYAIGGWAMFFRLVPRDSIPAVSRYCGFAFALFGGLYRWATVFYVEVLSNGEHSFSQTEIAMVMNSFMVVVGLVAVFDFTISQLRMRHERNTKSGRRKRSRNREGMT